MGRKIILFLILFSAAACVALRAQDADVRLNFPAYHLIDRLDIQGVADSGLITTTKPYAFSVVKNALNAGAESGDGWAATEARLYADDQTCSACKGWLGFVFQNRRDLLDYESEQFEIYANPMLYLSLGNGGRPLPGETFAYTFRNTRGFSVRGSLIGKIGFYAQLTDNQAYFPEYVDRRAMADDVVWGEGFQKPFGSRGYDYLSAKGYVTYSPAKPIRFKLGRDNAFWGDGVQSLWFSDYAVEHYMLQTEVRIWKLLYTSHLAQFIDFYPGKPDFIGTFPRKYGAFHQLSFKPAKQITLSVFESVIYAASQPNGRRGFELAYLNPVIFYRTIEQYLGSADNAFLGLSFKANILKRFQTYGQLLIDDYNFSRRSEGAGYWGNKFGYQIGLKALDLGVKRLDAQIEYNRVRPYMYAHFSPSANFSHYGQYLAHPYGANFSELIFQLRYRPVPRLELFAQFGYAQKGEDPPGNPALNYGGDIFRTNMTFNNGLPNPEFDNEVGQGLENEITRVNGRISYRWLNTQLVTELEGLYRQTTPALENNLAVCFNLRVFMPHKPVNY